MLFVLLVLNRVVVAVGVLTLLSATLYRCRVRVSKQCSTVPFPVMRLFSMRVRMLRAVPCSQETRTLQITELPLILASSPRTFCRSLNVQQGYANEFA